MSSSFLLALSSYITGDFSGETASLFSQLATIASRHYSSSPLADTPRLITDICPHDYITQLVPDQQLYLYLCKSPRPSSAPSMVVFDGLVSFIDSSVTTGGIPLSPRPVVVKFPRGSKMPKSSRALFSEVATAIRAAEVFSAPQSDESPGLVPSARIPIFAKFFGSVEASLFAHLAAKGVELADAAAPGAIFEFVEGELLTTALNASLMTLHAAVRPSSRGARVDENLVRDAHEVMRRRWEDWVGCITYQRVLIHLLSLSKGMYVSDLTMDKLVLDRRRRFVMSDEVVCEEVRVVDVKGGQDISKLDTVGEVAGKVAEAMRSLEDVYVWGNRNPKGDVLRVTEKVADLMAEVMRVDGTIEQVIFAFIAECIKKLEMQSAVCDEWILDLQETLIRKMFDEAPLFP